MARQKNTSLKVKNFFIFPVLLRKVSDDAAKDYRGINIRITDKKKIALDIECYDNSQPERIRIKSKPEFWNNGKISGGYSEDTVNNFNTCLHNIQSEIAKYVNGNDVIKKPLLMQFLYGGNFALSKKKRTKYITIPSEYHGRVIDTIDLTSKEITELLQPHLQKQTFTNSDGKEKTIEGIFDPDTGESMIQDEEDFNDMVIQLKNEKEDSIKKQTEKERIAKLSTEERYKQGYWNKQNIFEMFGSTYYDETVNETYTKIVVRLMEYREHVKPSEDIKDFNANWVNAFFNWLQKTGWYHINTRSFDPLKYDRSIFFQNKPRNQYEIKSLNKMKGILKALTVGVKGEKTVSFYKKGWLPLIDLSDVKADKNEKKGTRIDHNLLKSELDTLFHFKFQKSKLEQYQQIFNDVNKSENVTVTIEDLNIARDMFILQTFWGGLRGFKEYHTAKILKQSIGYVVSFYQNKVENTVINPLNEYTETILKKYKYKKPELQRVIVRSQKKTESLDLLEQHYRSLLRTIATILKFDREVLVDKKKNEFKQVKELFGPYFARKTFGQIMFDEYGLNESEIALFTGHVDGNETELGVSYINKHSTKTKLKHFERIKVGMKK